jgi:hypothetical protein
MRACSSALTLGIAMVFGITTLSAQGAKTANPRVGSWELNVAKSKYTPGPAPKGQTLKIEAAGEGERVTSEMVSASGAKTVVTYGGNYDGKPNPIQGSEIADTVSLKRIDANTTERTDTKNGKVVQTYTRVVSADGKTMTVTIKGMNAQGQAVNNVVVFERR